MRVDPSDPPPPGSRQLGWSRSDPRSNAPRCPPFCPPRRQTVPDPKCAPNVPRGDGHQPGDAGGEPQHPIRSRSADLRGGTTQPRHGERRTPRPVRAPTCTRRHRRAREVPEPPATRTLNAQGQPAAGPGSPFPRSHAAGSALNRRGARIRHLGRTPPGGQSTEQPPVPCHAVGKRGVTLRPAVFARQSPVASRQRRRVAHQHLDGGPRSGGECLKGIREGRRPHDDPPPAGQR